MLDDDYLENLTEEIELLIPYAVPPEELDGALGFLETFTGDYFGLEVIKDYYRTLPHAREEALIGISLLGRREQLFLLLLSTAKHRYFYLTNEEEGLFLGEWENGIQDREILLFFGYEDNESFLKDYPDPEHIPDYLPLSRVDENNCPSCGVLTGEMHTLGCPLEICPWCGGQLNHCNCRFEQLGVEELTDEQMVEEFIEQLEEKGRISYTREQRPGFMKE